MVVEVQREVKEPIFFFFVVKQHQDFELAKKKKTIIKI